MGASYSVQRCSVAFQKENKVEINPKITPATLSLEKENKNQFPAPTMKSNLNCIASLIQPLQPALLMTLMLYKVWIYLSHD